LTRTSNDQWSRAYRNLVDQRVSLRRAIQVIEARLAAPVAARTGRIRGYASAQERFGKQQRLQRLTARLAGVERRLADGRVSVVRGGVRLARSRHHLDEAGVTPAEWAQRWRASRRFVCADGEADKRWGNETIRVHPEEGWVEIRLPSALRDLSNTPGRAPTYRLSAPVGFSYRGDEWAAQAATGAVRYDVSFDPDKGRWYLDASWSAPAREPATLGDLGGARVLGVDLNAGHLAAFVLDASGNPTGAPRTVALDLTGAASRRDGRLRGAITTLVDMAIESGCGAIAIENLGFADAAATGRETMGRGRRGRSFRRTVAGIPTRRFRDRLVAMATNRGLTVIAVDPAYTSRWGAQHWQGPLQAQVPSPVTVTRHHAAAVVIGRRSQGHHARRRPGVTRPDQRIGNGELPDRPDAGPAAARNPGPRPADAPSPKRPKTPPAKRTKPRNQATQNRSEPPVNTPSATADRR
jgi:hypothetical protein